MSYNFLDSTRAEHMMHITGEPKESDIIKSTYKCNDCKTDYIITAKRIKAKGSVSSIFCSKCGNILSAIMDATLISIKVKE